MSTERQLSYPSDPADLFLRLYRDLDERCSRDGRAEEWIDDDQVRDIADLVAEAAVEEGVFDPERVGEQIELAGDEDARRYAYLIGIDRALALVHPATDAVDRGQLTRIAVRYRRTGRLNTNAEPGALLPRVAWPARLTIMEDPPTEILADLFDSVTVVSGDTWTATNASRVPRRYDLPATVRTEGLLVGCAPVTRRADVTISASADTHRRYYHIVPLSTTELEQRVTRIVERLDAAGVQLAVMPELTLSPALLEHWITALRTPPPRGSRLRLLLVGSGPLERNENGFATNRAVLLSRSGELLLSQDKRHGFSLTEDQVREWGLRDSLKSPGAYAEPLLPGETLSILETSIGRLTVMVCEDLGRIAQDGRGLIELGPSTMLTPVLSKPTLPHYWEHSDAKLWASEIGSDTVVANSLVIEDSMRQAGTLDEDHLGTALAHGAQGSYESGHASAPALIVAFRFTPEGPIRAVLLDRDE
jgi:predicted amidohydrolase